MASLESAKASVVGISTDSPWCLKEFKSRNRLQFPLLSDYNREVIRMYNVVQPDILGLKNLAKRAVYIIGTDGRIIWKWISDDPRIEPDYNKIISIANSIKDKKPGS